MYTVYFTSHLYYIISRLVAPLTIIEAPIQVSGILGLSVSFNFINLKFQIFPLFLPDITTSFTSYIA